MSSEARAEQARCWCGNVDLAGFLATYARCSACGTLVSLGGLTAAEVEVHDDDRDFYGKEYWFARQRDELGLPDIYQRARLDLPERCLYWLRVLLGSALPPARILDLGSSHGAFVALLRWAGFDASGLELSPWVVGFARKTFGIPMRQGPLEAQALPEHSFDVIVLNDVLEHVVSPLDLMGQCARLLDPRGFVVVQTPCYPDPQTHQELVDAQHPVLAMLQEREHLHLFSPRSVRQLFERVGLGTLRFESALFPYDMFFLASRAPLAPIEASARDAALLRSPSARLVRAMIDLDDRALDLSAQLVQVEHDRQGRIQTIERLNHYIEQTSANSEARLKVILDQQATIDRLSHFLEQTSVDSEARLKVILDQQATIDRLSHDMNRLSHFLEQTSVDSEARLKVILDQQATIDRLSHDMNRLSHFLEQTNVDSEARLKVILDQQATIDRLSHDMNRLSHFLEQTSVDSEARLKVILDQQATIDRLTEQGQAQLALIARHEERHADEVDARLRNLEGRQDAIARTRLVRLLRYLRVL
jgi:2-polyprenyl-3-methyl-5-hydroxy-6-metoxy-1,4-benzoquinol methylase